MRILLVDDDSGLRQVMARILRAGGIASISEAADGREALEMLECTNVDLIITDYQMPRLDGIGFVQALRGRGDRTPVIMLSGNSDSRGVVTAIRAGVSNYLPKPIEPSLLFEKIWQTLGVPLGAQKLSA